jgi:hypothetical protein
VVVLLSRDPEKSKRRNIFLIHETIPFDLIHIGARFLCVSLASNYPVAIFTYSCPCLRVKGSARKTGSQCISLSGPDTSLGLCPRHSNANSVKPTPAISLPG